MIISDESLEKKIQFKTDINANKELLSKFMISKINDLFYQVNDIINFEENSFFIIKTNEFKNWHPAIAQMDLSEVIDEILSGNREGNHERI